MIPKTANKQLKTKEFVNEVIEKKEAKIPKAAKKEPSLKPSNEDTEAQSQKPSSNTRIFLGTIFLAFWGIAAISTAGYFSYQDGRQNGINSILKDPKARTKIYYEKVYSDDFGYHVYLIGTYYENHNSQIEIINDIMTIAKKYEEECKSSAHDEWGTYFVANDCFEKLKEKHYVVSYPYDPKAWTIFLQL